MLLSLLLIPSSTRAFSQQGVDIHIDGPTEVFVQKTEEFKIEIRGEFATQEAINWSIEIQETMGVHIEPMTDDSTESNVFYVDITPLEEDTFTIPVKGYCSDGEEVRYSETNIVIETKEPKVLTLEVKNSHDYKIDRVRVGLYIDDTLVRIQNVNDLEPNETRMVEIYWTKEDLEPGEHTLEVWLDYGLHGEDRFVRGEQLISRTFHVERDRNYTWIILGVIAAVSGVIFFLYYHSKKKRKSRRPW